MTSFLHTHTTAPPLHNRYIASFVEDLSVKLKELTGARPFVVRSNLKRSKLDANEDVDKASQGEAGAKEAWQYLQNYYDDAATAASKLCGGNVPGIPAPAQRALFIDLHGSTRQGVNTVLTASYGLTRTEISGVSDAAVDAHATYHSETTMAGLLAAIPGAKLSALLRGPNSLGTLLHKHSSGAVDMTPSATNPNPGAGYLSQPLSSGGFNMRRQGSSTFDAHSARWQGAVDSVHINVPLQVRSDTAKRTALVAAMAASLVDFFAEWHGMDLTGAATRATVASASSGKSAACTASLAELTDTATRCRATCPPGTYSACPDGRSPCTPCAAGMYAVASGATTCAGTACASGRSGPAGSSSAATATCAVDYVHHCPVGTYAAGNTCVACSGYCVACADATTCTRCGGGQYLLNGKCLATCDAGYVGVDGLEDTAALSQLFGRRCTRAPDLAKNNMEYFAGGLPIILSVPHGGVVSPTTMPNRVPGCWKGGVCDFSKAARTAGGCAGGTPLDATNCEARSISEYRIQDFVRLVADALEARTQLRPYVVRAQLQRAKLDANRDVMEAAQEGTEAVAAWSTLQGYYAAAATGATTRCKGSTSVNHTLTPERALFLDIHGGAGAAEGIDIGYSIARERFAILADGAPSAVLAVEKSCSLYGLLQETGQSAEDAVRGAESLGTKLATRGFPSVPSATSPIPGSGYFEGGFNTQKQGSKAVSTRSKAGTGVENLANLGTGKTSQNTKDKELLVDSIQLELPYETRANGTALVALADALAASLVDMFQHWHGRDLTGTKARAAHIAAAKVTGECARHWDNSDTDDSDMCPMQCPRGKFSRCADGFPPCTDCPSGTFAATTGAAGKCVGVVCAAGTYSSASVVRKPTSDDVDCKGCPAGKYASSSGQFACKSVTVQSCSAGHGLAPATALADGVCTHCVVGTTFNPNAGTGVCGSVSVKTCGAGLGLKPATALADGVCEPCIAGSTFSAGDSAQVCAAVLVDRCGPGLQLSVSTARADGTCAACPAGTFSVANDASPCGSFTVTTCPTGHGLTAGTASANARCGACIVGSTFSNRADASACTVVSVTRCGGGLGFVAATDSADAECVACAAGKTASATDDTAPCLPNIVTQCGAGYGFVAATSSSSATCSQCAASVAFSATEGASPCRSHTRRSCSAGDGFVAGTSVRDSACTACSAGTFSASSGNSQTGCIDHSTTQVCAKGSGVVAGTATADVSCQSCATGSYSSKVDTWPCASHSAGRKCPGGSGVVPGSATSDSSCAPCVQGQSFSPGESSAPCQPVTLPSSAACAASSSGGAGIREYTPPTPRADGACDVSSCPPGQGWYLVSNAPSCTACVANESFSGTNDANPCQGVSVGTCGPGQGFVHSTVSTDATCEVCGAGMFSADNGHSTCIPHSTPQCAATEEMVAGSDEKDTSCVMKTVADEKDYTDGDVAPSPTPSSSSSSSSTTPAPTPTRAPAAPQDDGTKKKKKKDDWKEEEEEELHFVEGDFELGGLGSGEDISASMELALRESIAAEAGVSVGDVVLFFDGDCIKVGQLPACSRCTDNSQCAKGFCSPFRKLCLLSASLSECPGSGGAYCSPTCHSAIGCTCSAPMAQNWPNKWQKKTCGGVASSLFLDISEQRPGTGGEERSGLRYRPEEEDEVEGSDLAVPDNRGTSLQNDGGEDEDISAQSEKLREAEEGGAEEEGSHFAAMRSNSVSDSPGPADPSAITAAGAGGAGGGATVGDGGVPVAGSSLKIKIGFKIVSDRIQNVRSSSDRSSSSSSSSSRSNPFDACEEEDTTCVHDTRKRLKEEAKQKAAAISGKLQSSASTKKIADTLREKDAGFHRMHDMTIHDVSVTDTADDGKDGGGKDGDTPTTTGGTKTGHTAGWTAGWVGTKSTKSGAPERARGTYPFTATFALVAASLWVAVVGGDSCSI